MTEVKIEPSWKHVLEAEFQKGYFIELATYVRQEYLTKSIYPPPHNVFRAFALCPFDNVRVVIVGQDPYHGAGQANGLSFAVSDQMPIPPSLKNIFKEIESDLGVATINSGDVSRWAKQGVLLLNAVLTVQAGTPASHKGKGWEVFTDAVVGLLNAKKKNIVYLLWGRYAQEKGAFIDRRVNLVLESAHPSPFSASQFFGNHHFSQCNTYLALQGEQGIDWR